jgi:hypothetical protein
LILYKIFYKKVLTVYKKKCILQSEAKDNNKFNPPRRLRGQKGNGMKLMDLLKLMNKNDFVYLGVEVCGMQFETKHSVDFFIDNADILNDKEILGTYLEDGNFHIRLEK